MNMNSTTAITLNDRFSMIKKPSQTQITRGRSRSRSREPRQRQMQQRQQRGVDLRGSQRNRALLDKLEQQHKLRMALKLKNVRKVYLVLFIQYKNYKYSYRKAF